jgi:hypothetical protein
MKLVHVVGAACAALAGCAGRPGTPVERPAPVVDVPPAEPTLVPTGLELEIPATDAIEVVIIGHDDAADICVVAIYDFSSSSKDPSAPHCDDFSPGFPYIQLSRGRCGLPSESWNQTETISATGCGPSRRPGASALDTVVHVKGRVFTGAIRLKSTR